MNICSVDPGISGAITFYDGKDYKIFSNYKFKNKKGKTEFDLQKVADIINENKPDIVIIELQVPIPGQSSVATGTTMKNYGSFLGILATLRVPYKIVFSRTWMKKFVGKNKYTKEIGAKCLLKMLPNMKEKIYTKRGKLLDGIVDSVLMNIYFQEEIKYGKI